MQALIRAVANKPIGQEVIVDTASRIARVRASDEGREGMAAFLEKRKRALPRGPFSTKPSAGPTCFRICRGWWIRIGTPGRFVLTGSQQFGLLAGITQSLAGRVGVTHLLPLALGELPATTLRKTDPDALMQRGGYPALHAGEMNPTDWFASYVATYIERDVRQVLRIRDLSSFQRFLRLCAGRTGQLLNLNALGEEAGIAHSTARAWLSLLEASYPCVPASVLPPQLRQTTGQDTEAVFHRYRPRGVAARFARVRSTRAAPDARRPVREFHRRRISQGTLQRRPDGRPVFLA
jgi:hypothetical protein